MPDKNDVILPEPEIVSFIESSSSAGVQREHQFTELHENKVDKQQKLSDKHKSSSHDNHKSSSHNSSSHKSSSHKSSSHNHKKDHHKNKAIKIPHPPSPTLSPKNPVQLAVTWSYGMRERGLRILKYPENSIPDFAQVFDYTAETFEKKSKLVLTDVEVGSTRLEKEGVAIIVVLIPGGGEVSSWPRRSEKGRVAGSRVCWSRRSEKSKGGWILKLFLTNHTSF